MGRRIRIPSKFEQARSNHYANDPTYCMNLNNYCESDKSDPFARARAEAHLRSGVIGYTDKGFAAYAATPTKVNRTAVINGRLIEWTAFEYRSGERP